MVTIRPIDRAPTRTSNDITMPEIDNKKE